MTSFTGEICVQHNGNPATHLKPHSVIHPGTPATRLATVPEGEPIWIVSLEGGKVIVGCTEEQVTPTE